MVAYPVPLTRAIRFLPAVNDGEETETRGHASR